MLDSIVANRGPSQANIPDHLLSAALRDEGGGSRDEDVDGTLVGGSRDEGADGTLVGGSRDEDVGGTRDEDVDGTRGEDVDGTRDEDVDGTRNEDVDGARAFVCLDGVELEGGLEDEKNYICKAP